MREKLIDAILNYASDEFENKYDVIQLAKESEEQLLDRLINILEWYKNAYNEAI